MPRIRAPLRNAEYLKERKGLPAPILLRDGRVTTLRDLLPRTLSTPSFMTSDLEARPR
jgi:hypothetical protein